MGDRERATAMAAEFDGMVARWAMNGRGSDACYLTRSEGLLVRDALRAYAAQDAAAPDMPAEVREVVAKEIRAIGGDTIITETEDSPETKQGLFARRTPIGYPPLGWTCFHCGETFTTYGAARDHFGCDQLDDPACRIKAGDERGLVMALRKAEAEIKRLCSEERDYQQYVASIRDTARPTVGETWETPEGAVMVAPVNDSEAEFEMWQGGIPVASAFGQIADAANEMQHYAMIYSPDGPIEIKRVIRIPVMLAAVAKETTHD